MQQPGQLHIPNRKDLETSGLLSIAAFSGRYIYLQSGFSIISASEHLVITTTLSRSTPLSHGEGLGSFIACMGTPESRVHLSHLQLFSYYNCLIIREARPVPLQDFSVHPMLWDTSNIRNILSLSAD